MHTPCTFTGVPARIWVSTCVHVCVSVCADAHALRSPHARFAAAAQPGEFPSSFCSEASTLQVLHGHAATAPIRRTSPPAEHRRQFCSPTVCKDALLRDRSPRSARARGQQEHGAALPTLLRFPLFAQRRPSPSSGETPTPAKPHPPQRDPNKTPSTIAAPLAEGAAVQSLGGSALRCLRGFERSTAPTAGGERPEGGWGGGRWDGAGRAVSGPGGSGGRRVRERRLHTKERRSEPHRAGNQSPRRPCDKRGCGATGGARTERGRDGANGGRTDRRSAVRAEPFFCSAAEPGGVRRVWVCREQWGRGTKRGGRARRWGEGRAAGGGAPRAALPAGAAQQVGVFRPRKMCA